MPRFLPLLLACTLTGAVSARAAELIREVDAQGRVRIIREVAEDAAGNCVNHGQWQMVSPDGAALAEGRYEMGRRTGEWRRWLAAADASPSMAEWLRGFDEPLVSRATFAGGRLNGEWTVTDARGRPCLSIQLVEGVRQGEFRAWAPTGELIRSQTYDRGRIEGHELTWSDADNRLVHTATWLHGYRLIRSTAFYENAVRDKRAEGDYLMGPQRAVAPDEFWTCYVGEYHMGSACIPHGLWRQWFPGGQLAAEGRYAWGRPVGSFTWRHANGQKAASGAYATDGSPAGEWRWWNADGAQLAEGHVGPPGANLGTAPLQMARQPAATDPFAVR